MVQRLRKGLVLSFLAVIAAGGAVASARPTRRTLRHTHTFTLAAGTTRTLRVAYPDALKYGRSKYAGKVRTLTPAHARPGSTPSLSRVHILSRTSCQGGSDLCARVRNGNPRATAAVRVRVTAITELPAGKRP